jgi:hypothetical protein
MCVAGGFGARRPVPLGRVVDAIAHPLRRLRP